jgi:hypothetical protein
MSTPARLRAPITAILGATVALGCTDLSHYSTHTGEAYCGSITLSSKFREGFVSPAVQMRLDLDANAIDVDGAIAGHIATYEAFDPTLPPNRLFVGAPLRPIDKLFQDTLSQLDFGEGNVKNAIYAVSPEDPDVESMLAVISLRSDDGVDVRLIRPGLADTAGAVPAGRQPVYGLFPLTKQRGLCGF